MKRKGLNFRKPAFMLFVMLIATMAFGANGWAQVAETEPINGATGVSVDTTVKVVFNDDVNGITNSTFFVTTGAGGYSPATVTGTVSYNDKVAEFKPANALQYNNTYTVTLTKGVAGLTSDYTWKFTTAKSSAGLPALISSTDPADGDTDADVNKVVVNFAKEMNESTINENSFFITTGSGGYSPATVTGTVSCDGMVATFTPASPLNYKTAYTANLRSSVAASDGTSLGKDHSWTFTTKEEGGVTPGAPKVVSVTPENGATGVALNTAVTVTFSEDMDSSTLGGAFTLKGGTGYGVSSVAVTMSYDSENKTATYKPASALTKGTAYTATITTSAKSVDDKSLEAGKTWSFTTTTGGGTGPSVSSATPSDGATDVSVSTVIKAVFSKAMNPSTITPDTFYVGTGTGYDLENIAGTVNCTGDTATFTPSSPLDFETTYSAVITTGAEDADGNSLEADYKWSFTTGEEGAVYPTVTEQTENANGLTFTFSSEMNYESVRDSLTVKVLIPGVGYGIVAGDFNYDGTTATFMPYSRFIPGASYEVSLTGARDVDGNYLKFDEWTFPGSEYVPEDTDDDGDGYTENEGDCDDTDDSVYPGATEICGDDIDQDCDGSDLECFVLSDFIVDNEWHLFVTESFADGFNFEVTLKEFSSDGTWSNGTWSLEDDIIGINDVNGGNLTGTVAEIEGRVGMAGSGISSEGVDWLWIAVPSEEGLFPDPADYHLDDFYELLDEYVDDNDGDGYKVTQGDCDDDDASVYPGATEIPDDGIDQDCDGSDLS